VADGARRAPFPVTVIWGLYDTVSPPRVASYVWNEYLMLRPGGNRLYFIPDANHYLQNDRPDAFVKVLLHALEPADDQGPGALEAELGAYGVFVIYGPPNVIGDRQQHAPGSQAACRQMPAQGPPATGFSASPMAMMPARRLIDDCGGI
jgi:hypothetical protein